MASCTKASLTFCIVLTVQSLSNRGGRGSRHLLIICECRYAILKAPTHDGVDLTLGIELAFATPRICGIGLNSADNIEPPMGFGRHTDAQANQRMADPMQTDYRNWRGRRWMGTTRPHFLP